MAKFLATLNPTSFIYKTWLSKGRMGGTVDTVIFNRFKDKYLSTDLLTEDQVSTILARQDKSVILEMIHVPELAIEDEKETRTPVVKEPVLKPTSRRRIRLN